MVVGVGVGVVYGVGVGVACGNAIVGGGAVVGEHVVLVGVCYVGCVLVGDRGVVEEVVVDGDVGLVVVSLALMMSLPLVAVV